MKNALVVAIIAFVLGGGAGFFGGMKYQQSKVPTLGQFPGGGTQRVFNGNTVGSRADGGQSGGIASGEIIGQDDSSLTLQLPNEAGTKTIYFSDSTEISKMADGTKLDLTAGTNVIVAGTANSDGSIAAKTISIRGGGEFLQPPAEQPKE